MVFPTKWLAEAARDWRACTRYAPVGLSSDLRCVQLLTAASLSHVHECAAVDFTVFFTIFCCHHQLHPELQVLPPVSVPACLAQEILRTITREKMGGSSDDFVCQVGLGSWEEGDRVGDIECEHEDEPEGDVWQASEGEVGRKEEYGQLILSERCLYWLKRQDYRGEEFCCSHSSILKQLRWHCVWEQVQRVEVVTSSSSSSSSPSHCLRLHLQGGGAGQEVTIPCSSRAAATRVYESFCANQHRIHRSASGIGSRDVQRAGGDLEGGWIRLLVLSQ